MSTSTFRVCSGATAAGLTLAALAGPAALAAAPATPAAGASVAAPEGITSKLDRAFRSDLSEVDVTYDYWPEEDRLDAHATLQLTMRPDQERALFHFNPLRDGGARAERQFITTLQLDGEVLDPQDDVDLQPIRTFPSAERAYEVQRDLEPGSAHTLEVTWSMPYEGRKRHPGWFYATFDDTEGPSHQTETDWPTVSSPEELARHRIDLRVHSEEPYTVVGSGSVDPIADDAAQEWEIDTEQAVSSSVVFFAAVPQADARTVEFEQDGVDVTIVSTRDTDATDRAQHIAEDTIERLVDELGPFPTERMQILLTGWSSGMEYYGATRTGNGSLEHELVHMYFGTTTVNRTWRDTWFDESAVEWWLRREGLKPLPEGYTSDLACDRSVVAPGFDLRAYGKGARILDEVADALGGDGAMIDFLADLHERRAYDPFTTDDLIDDIVGAQDEIDRDLLEQWLYTGD